MSDAWERHAQIDREYMDRETDMLKGLGESIIRRARNMVARPNEEDVHLIGNAEAAISELLLELRQIKADAKRNHKPAMIAAE